MSGPKKADVEAQLNVARNSQRRCAGLISKAADSAIATVLNSAAGVLHQAEQAGVEAQRTAAGLSGDMARVAPDGVRNAQSDAAAARKSISTARAALTQAQESVARARQEEQAADAVFAQAGALLEQAAEATRAAGAHYLHDQMRQATEAKQLFDRAAAELAKAANTRKEAERRANQALREANEALAAARNAGSRAQAAHTEAEARLRAEEEARKIAEEQRRRATLATEQARAAVTRLESTPHEKFRPGQGAQVRRELEAAQALLAKGDMPGATAAAEAAVARAQNLEQEVAAALQEYERQRAEAGAQISGLQAAIQGMDSDLIAHWADNPRALESANAALAAANAQLGREQFTEAAAQAQAARDAVNQALANAAENQSNHERRSSVGEAIMDVLEELGFQVGQSEGSRTEPLKIVGQTPDLSGQGDFAISIPLNGEIDFTVTEAEGGTSCVAAVNALRDRLAERGVNWNTTDWGHASGAAFAPGERERTQERERERQRG